MPQPLGGLWVLLLGTVLFMSSFVMLIGLLPSEFTYTYKDYEQVYNGTARDLRASKITAWSQSENFTISHPQSIKRVYTEHDVRFAFSTVVGQKVFSIYHVEWYIPFTDVPVRGHFLETEPYQHIYVTKERLFQSAFYDSLEDTSQIEFACEHITISVIFQSPSENLTLAEAWDNGQLHLALNYEVDFTKMGSSVWTILASILTFQVISTGVLLIDIVLNTLISLPLYLSISYILYRVVTGLIPTLSGGGGA